MFINIHLSPQLMINIEITNNIQHCIIFTNDTHFLHKEFINGFFFVGNMLLFQLISFFIIITSLSKLLTPSLQHWRLVNNQTMLKIV
jgi:hypothetical protein